MFKKLALLVLSTCSVNFGLAAGTQTTCKKVLNTAFETHAKNFEKTDAAEYVQHLREEHHNATPERKTVIEQSLEFASLIKAAHVPFTELQTLKTVQRSSNFAEINLTAEPGNSLQGQDLQAALRLTHDSNIKQFLKALGVKRARIFSVDTDIKQLMGYVSSSFTVVVEVHEYATIHLNGRTPQVRLYVKFQEDGSLKVVEFSM